MTTGWGGVEWSASQGEAMMLLTDAELFALRSPFDTKASHLSVPSASLSHSLVGGVSDYCARSSCDLPQKTAVLPAELQHLQNVQNLHLQQLGSSQLRLQHPPGDQNTSLFLGTSQPSNSVCFSASERFLTPPPDFYDTLQTADCCAGLGQPCAGSNQNLAATEGCSPRGALPRISGTLQGAANPANADCCFRKMNSSTLYTNAPVDIRCNRVAVITSGSRALPNPSSQVPTASHTSPWAASQPQQAPVRSTNTAPDQPWTDNYASMFRCFEDSDALAGLWSVNGNIGCHGSSETWTGAVQRPLTARCVEALPPYTPQDSPASEYSAASSSSSSKTNVTLPIQDLWQPLFRPPSPPSASDNMSFNVFQMSPNQTLGTLPGTDIATGLSASPHQAAVTTQLTPGSSPDLSTMTRMVNQSAKTPPDESARDQLTITVKAFQEDETQLSRMCPRHPRMRDIRIRRLERLPSHRRHFRCETCTEILQLFSDKHGLYPSQEEKDELLLKVGLSQATLNYWFANRRRAQQRAAANRCRTQS